MGAPDFSRSSLTSLASIFECYGQTLIRFLVCVFLAKGARAEARAPNHNERLLRHG